MVVLYHIFHTSFFGGTSLHASTASSGLRAETGSCKSVGEGILELPKEVDVFWRAMHE
jgi:hypothetical protein